jgi:hypothetical protein
MNRWIVRLAAVTLATMVVLGPMEAQAAPRLLPYQGRVTDAAGTPLNGQFQIQFSLYSVSTGGSALFTQADQVTVTNGLFSVVLGTGGFPSGLFDNGNLFVGIKVGADPEMTPRQQLLPVAYALRATEPIDQADHDFTVTFVVSATDVRFVVVNENGTILRQSGGFNVSHSSPGSYNVNHAAIDESAPGITLSAYNRPGAGTSPAVVTGFANDGNGLNVVTYVFTGGVSPTPGFAAGARANQNASASAK